MYSKREKVERAFIVGSKRTLENDCKTKKHNERQRKIATKRTGRNTNR